MAKSKSAALPPWFPRLLDPASYVRDSIKTDSIVGIRARFAAITTVEVWCALRGPASHESLHVAIRDVVANASTPLLLYVDLADIELAAPSLTAFKRFYEQMCEIEAQVERERTDALRERVIRALSADVALEAIVAAKPEQGDGCDAFVTSVTPEERKDIEEAIFAYAAPRRDASDRDGGNIAGICREWLAAQRARRARTCVTDNPRGFSIHSESGGPVTFLVEDTPTGVVLRGLPESE